MPDYESARMREYQNDNAEYDNAIKKSKARQCDSETMPECQIAKMERCEIVTKMQKCKNTKMRKWENATDENGHCDKPKMPECQSTCCECERGEYENARMRK